jgi:EamA domain-containing membrane protein RarD
MRQTENKHLITKMPLKIFGVAALLGALCIGFLGYLTPSMLINWETIASMCGF